MVRPLALHMNLAPSFLNLELVAKLILDRHSMVAQQVRHQCCFALLLHNISWKSKRRH